MSDTVDVGEYAIVFIWLVICSVYTTLLTVTALAVVFILRKRRSSILKSQRAPRTPLSELEFNVTTPTETTKSRRVSFSRRTGVAEFITNEATTTWKNFYEEHNKSLESSGNDSKINAPRQLIDHLGKCIYDQQFEEVEAVEFIDNFSVNTSVNVPQQLMSLECTGDDRKLSAPLSNFELSTFTDHQSKIFGDELRIQSLCEMSGGINVNFSAVHTIPPKDDLEEMQRDLESAQASNDTHQSLIANRNMSDYIEIDLNTTRIRTEDIDMSITDTIPSPKVQDVGKSSSIDNRLNLSKDMLADKENIAINPYAAQCESVNFAINQESDKVLVFDGKRLTLQSEQNDLQNYRQTLLPNALAEHVPKRKTIVLNMKDGLPNFVDDLQVSNTDASKTKEHIKNSFHSDCDIGNMSTTRAVVSNLIIPGESNVSNVERTLFYGENTGNISITQAIPTNIVYNENLQKRRTILSEANTVDISITKAVSSNIILVNQADVIVEKENDNTHFETDSGDMSMTQALPANIIFDKILEERRKTLCDSYAENMSMTQALSGHIIQKTTEDKMNVDENGVPNTSTKYKNATVMHENNSNDISITCPISNVILCQKELLIEHNNDKYDDVAVDITDHKKIHETIKTNIPDRIENVSHEKDTDDFVKVPQDPINEDNDWANMKQKEKRQTIVYRNDEADISMTCALPRNIIITGDTGVVSERRQTIVFDDNCDISMTEALPFNVLLETSGIMNKINTYDTSKAEPGELKQKTSIIENIDIKELADENVVAVNKRQTFVIENDVNMSITESFTKIPDTSKIEPDETKQKTSLFVNNAIKKSADEKVVETNKRQTIVFDNDVDMSITEPIIPNTEIARRNISFHQSNSNALSTTKAFPSESLSLQNELENMKGEHVFNEDKSIVRSKRDILVYQAETTHSQSSSKLQLKITDQEDLESVKTINNESYSKDPVATSIIILNNKIIVEKENIDKSLAPVIAPGFDSNVIHEEDEEATETNKSVLDDLLDMSAISIEDDVDDKNVMAKMESEQQILNNKNCDKTKESNESMFYIMKDSDEEVQTEIVDMLSSDREINNIKGIEETQQLKHKSLLKLEYVEENPTILHDVQTNPGELKSILHDNKSPPKNRYYEKVISSDIDSEMICREISPKKSMNTSNVRKSIKNADDTNALLQLLSDYTDDKESDYIEENDVNTEPSKGSEHIAIENKSKIIEPKRISVIAKKPLFLNSEELLINISKARAELLKSRIDLDDSEKFDDTEIESPETLPLKKSVRMSKEVVKALEFEDDTDSDTSIQSEKISPLKKTAFGETTYMKENKAKVIPSYLKEVPDEIKELMHDLVKPTTDTMPFETSGLDKHLKNVPSTCSTQIQANLITSSQIDVHTELYSNPASAYNIHKHTMADEVARLCNNQVISHQPKTSIKRAKLSASDKSLEAELVADSSFKENVYRKSFKQDGTIPERVLVFDHHNPLNNVLLAPLNQYEAHRYNPVKSSETLCDSERSDSVQISINEKAFEVERISVHYDIENHAALTRLSEPSGDTCSEKQGDTNNVSSNLSKRVSIDQSVDVKMTEVRDIDVNTAIAMKDNKELLEASSSLTLVDDALTRSAFDVNIVLKDNIPKADSPVKFEHQTEKHVSIIMPEKMDSDITSQDEEPEQLRRQSKPKKRSYSPTKRDKHKHSPMNSDLTPKPISKMQKLSNSPDIINPTVGVHQSSSDKDKKYYTQEKNMETKPKDQSTKIDDTFTENKGRSPRKSKANKFGTTVTVQRFIAEYNRDEKELRKEIVKASNESKYGTSTVESGTETRSDIEEAESLDVISSFTSSKNLNAAREDKNIALEYRQTANSSVMSRGCIKPELVTESKDLTECDSSVNVVAKIDMLPFMGSHECEWETSTGDVWSFLLMYARIRLTVRLAHRHGNATRSYVRADTPVESLSVEIIKHDKGETVAIVAVGFAAESMRYVCACVCPGAGVRGRAAELPELVRRCGLVARVALRWAHVMHNASLRLAYRLSLDGLLTLKVANIPLRSVWEVTMRLELVVNDSREAPWPRANDVRVTSVISDYPVSEAAVSKVIANVPHNWGHISGTLWRIFKYLKHRTKDDDLLAI